MLRNQRCCWRCWLCRILRYLCGDKRSQNIVYSRQAVMDFFRGSSLPKIGKEFGGRDHTTVIHATSKIARLIEEDRSVYNLVQEPTALGQHFLYEIAQESGRREAE